MTMLFRVLVVAMAVGAAGCASSGERADEGPARAMERLPRDVRDAAEGYIAALDGVGNTLSRVTDTATARAAMPELESQLSELTRTWRVLEGADERKQADARYAYYRSLAGAGRRFEAQVSRVKGTPGVGTVLTPLLDKIPRWR